MLNLIGYEKECKRITNGFVLYHKNVLLDKVVSKDDTPQRLQLFNTFVKKAKEKYNDFMVVNGYLRKNLKYFNVHVYPIIFGYFYVRNESNGLPDFLASDAELLRDLYAMDFVYCQTNGKKIKLNSFDD